jgi:hypothetical protein
VTDVRLVDYVAASWAGMLPGTSAYVYLGSVGKEAVSAAGGGGLDSGAKVALYGGQRAGWLLGLSIGALTEAAEPSSWPPIFLLPALLPADCAANKSTPPATAAVGAVATLWATKLVAGAASSALDQQEEQAGQLLGGKEEGPL